MGKNGNLKLSHRGITSQDWSMTDVGTGFRWWLGGGGRASRGGGWGYVIDVFFKFFPSKCHDLSAIRSLIFLSLDPSHSQYNVYMRVPA